MINAFTCSDCGTRLSKTGPCWWCGVVNYPPADTDVRIDTVDVLEEFGSECSENCGQCYRIGCVHCLGD